MSKLFTNDKFLIALLLISIAVALLTLWQREIGTDDAWFAEQSYWFAQNGYVKSELFRGMNQVENRHLAYHRLHVWQGALVAKLFNWSAYTFKSILLFYFIILLISSYLFIKTHKIFTERSEYILFYLLTIAYAILIKLSFTYRPDIIVMVFGFLSFFMVFSAIKTEHLYNSIFAGIFAGLAVLTHLNGIIFIVAGSMVLLLSKKYRLFFYFSTTSFVVSLLYLIIIQDKADLLLYLLQMKNNPALSEKDFSFFGSTLKLLSSYKSYFHKGSDASYTLLFVLVFWTQRKLIFNDENLRIIFIYFISAAISLALLSPGAKSLYLVYNVPYVFLLIAILYKHMYEQSIVRQRIFTVMLCLFFLTQWGESISLFNKKTPGLPAMHVNVVKTLGMQPGDRIVAPIIFVFNEMENFTIQCFHVYRVMAGQKIIQLEKDFFNVASKDQRKFLVLTDHHLRDLRVKNPKKGEHYGNYVYLGLHGPYHGFRHLSEDS